MELREVISYLEKEVARNPSKRICLGLTNPHVYPLDHYAIAFETCDDMLVNDILVLLKTTLKKTLRDEKGIGRRVEEYTDVYIVNHMIKHRPGYRGEELGETLLDYMLTDVTVLPDDEGHN